MNPSGNAIGWEKEGELIGGFAVDEWNGKNCFAHIRIEGFVPKMFWFAIVDWVFNELGCERMTAPVSSVNEKCLRLLNHIGFIKEATLEDSSYDGADICFMTWKKRDCYMLKWGKK